MRRPGSGGAFSPDKGADVVRDGPGMPAYSLTGRDSAGAGKAAHNLGAPPARDASFARHDPDDPDVLRRLFHIDVAD